MLKLFLLCFLHGLITITTFYLSLSVHYEGKECNKNCSKGYCHLTHWCKVSFESFVIFSGRTKFADPALNSNHNVFYICLNNVTFSLVLSTIGPRMKSPATISTPTVPAMVNHPVRTSNATMTWILKIV